MLSGERMEVDCSAYCMSTEIVPSNYERLARVRILARVKISQLRLSLSVMMTLSQCQFDS